MAETHNALVMPMSGGYAVSCSCGWIGGDHDAPERAECKAKAHEASLADAERALAGDGATR